VGSLTIEGIAADVTADLGVGEVHVTLPKESIGSAAIDTGIGEASLVASGRRYSSEGLFTRTIHWNQGPGHARSRWIAASARSTSRWLEPSHHPGPLLPTREKREDQSLGPPASPPAF